MILCPYCNQERKSSTDNHFAKCIAIGHALGKVHHSNMARPRAVAGARIVLGKKSQEFAETHYWDHKKETSDAKPSPTSTVRGPTQARAKTTGKRDRTQK